MKYSSGLLVPPAPALQDVSSTKLDARGVSAVPSKTPPTAKSKARLTKQARTQAQNNTHPNSTGSSLSDLRKFFEESQGLKAPGPGPSGPRRSGRRWTVVVNQARTREDPRGPVTTWLLIRVCLGVTCLGSLPEFLDFIFWEDKNFVLACPLRKLVRGTPPKWLRLYCGFSSKPHTRGTLKHTNL